MFHSIALLLSLFFVLPALAHESSESSTDEMRVLKTITLENGEKAAVLVKEGGHLIGQPFHVVLKARCGHTSANPMDWPVQDSFSVCDLKPDSVLVNEQKNAVALKTKMANLADYDEQVSRGALHPEITCQSKTQVKKFSLLKICGH